MRKKLKLKIEIEVLDISVDDGYYTIKYAYKINGGKPVKDEYDSDYEGWTEKQWKEMLIEGEAVRIIASDVVESLI